MDECGFEHDRIRCIIAVDSFFELLYSFEEHLDDPHGMIVAALLEGEAQRRSSGYVLVDHTARQSHDGRACRDVLDDDRPRPNSCSRSDVDGAQYLRTRADHNSVAKSWVPFLLLQAGAAQRHPLVEHDVIADLGRFADYDTHAVVDDKPATDGRPWMDLDAGDGATRLADQPCEKRMPPSPQPVGKSVHRYRMESGIQEQHFGDTSRRRVAVEDGLDVFAELPPEAKPPTSGSPTFTIG
mgnify:FL=1